MKTRNKTPTNTQYNEWILHANKLYKSSSEVIKFQNYIKKQKLLGVEQEWFDEYFQPLLDFFGTDFVWQTLVPNVEIYGTDRKMPSNTGIEKSSKPQGHFSSAHWTSRLPKKTEWFDPYNEYQVYGTNQFCQTFALMHLCNALPPVSKDHSWAKYYTYTKAALEFMKSMLNKYFPYEKQLIKSVKVCIKYYKVCLNCIELPRF